MEYKHNTIYDEVFYHFKQELILVNNKICGATEMSTLAELLHITDCQEVLPFKFLVLLIHGSI